MKPPSARAGLLRRWLPRLVGPVALVVIVARTDLNALAATLAETSVGTLVVAYLVFVPSLALRSLRWRVLMQGTVEPLTYRESLSTYAYAILVGAVTPGRIGELAKVFHLQARGNNFGASFFTVILDRLFDVLVLVFFALGAFSSMALWDGNGVWAAASVGGAVAAVLAVLWWATRGSGYRMVTSLLQRVAPTRWRSRLSAFHESFATGAQGTRMSSLAVAALLTIMAWSANFLSVFLLARALGFDVSYIDMASVAAACALVALVPVTVMGIGTRDTALIPLMAAHGIGVAGSLALSTLILSLILAGTLMCSFSLLTPAARFDVRKA